MDLGCYVDLKIDTSAFTSRLYINGNIDKLFFTLLFEIKVSLINTTLLISLLAFSHKKYIPPPLTALFINQIS